MFNLLILILLIMLISLVFLILNFLLYKKTLKNREKSSPFECGFDPLSNNRIPFSIHFFLISLIFLIFDVEITLLIPIVSVLFTLNKPMMITSLFFFLILILGLYIEFLEKSIDWKK